MTRSEQDRAHVAAIDSSRALREEAEARLYAELPQALEGALISAADSAVLLHDLRVFQIELEMQNEELRRVQFLLEAERERYFDMYDLAPVGYCTVSIQGLILQANLTAATLLGVGRGILPGQPVTRFILQPDQDAFYLCRQRLLASGEAQACELRMRKADGDEFWANVVVAIARDDAGVQVLRMTMTNIHENKLAQAKLRASEERYRGLFNAMDEGYCIIDVIFDAENCPVDYRFLEVNQSFEKQSGIVGATGRRVREVFPTLEQRWFDTYGHVALSGEPVHFTDAAKALGGRWFEINAFRLGAAGSHKVAVIFNDVSERIRAEAERARLDQIVQDKNIELLRAIDVADRANRAKSDFLSGMSHELRTPLSAILGFAQLMESGTPAPTPSQQRSIDQILRSGWYLLDLINEILDLALVESGKMALSLEPIALNAVLAECVAMIEPQAQRRGIGLVVPKFDAGHFVIADWTRLKQVLINILSNAIKYNRPQGRVAVDCRICAPGRIRISVKDEGDGLSAAKLAQLFQPFNRLGQEASTEEGTGIGLVVSKQLIELMGGAIGVASTVGSGSEFWIELTLTAQREHVVATAVDSARAASTGAVSDTHTLLYVEDNPANLMLVEELVLRRNDIRLLSASDGTRGLEIARRTLPDVILMDINLPGISGSETLSALRADPETAHIPVVALSANAMKHDIERGLAAGFFRYLTKPIRINEFMETLDLALERARSRRAHCPPKEPT